MVHTLTSGLHLWNCDVYGRYFFLLCLKFSVHLCVHFVVVVAVFWFGLILFSIIIFIFNIFFSNHTPLHFSRLPAEAVSLNHEELLFAWKRLKDGWCALLLRGNLKRWSGRRGGTTHETQLGPRWVWDPALLGHYRAWSLLLLMAKITYSLHFTSLTISYRRKKLTAS